MITNLFSVPLGSRILRDLDHDAIADYLEWKPTTERDSSRIDLNGAETELQKLYDLTHLALEDFAYEIGVKGTPIITERWANVDNDVRTYASHCHPGYTFVCVYYPKFDYGAGGLMLKNPNSAHEFVFTDNILENNRNAYTSALYNLIPDEGELIIFPAYLEHYVIPPEIDNTRRISIAMNAEVKT